jgi:hypothetical protein
VNIAISPNSAHFGLSRATLYRMVSPLGGVADYIAAAACTGPFSISRRRRPRGRA